MNAMLLLGWAPWLLAAGDSDYKTAIVALASVVVFLAAVIGALYKAGHKCQEEKAKILERHEKALGELVKVIREDR